MDLSKLTTSDKVIAGSGIGLLIFSFFPWFSWSPGMGIRSFTLSGWDFFIWGIVPVLLGLAMVVLVAIKAFSPETQLPDLPVTYGQVFLGAGGLAAVLVVLKLLIGHHDLSRSVGLFLSVIAAIGLAAGGFLKFQEEQKGVSSTPPSTF